jgi:hypothetical protein
VLVLALKVQLLCALFILVRAALPRLRFDQLLQLCWKLLFPLLLALVVALVGVGYAALQLELGTQMESLPAHTYVGRTEYLTQVPKPPHQSDLWDSYHPFTSA